MKIILIYANLLLPFLCQKFEWTWLGGNSTLAPGNYSVFRTPSPLVYPGSRAQHASVIHPLTFNFVLFGGSSVVRGVPWTVGLNDLWSYDPVSGLWTWLSGNNDPAQNGIYGIRNIPSSTNMPGARSLHSAVIHPVSGLFFTFGGYGYGSTTTPYQNLNDLWSFNFLTKQWTWVSGSNVGDHKGIYGNKGISFVSNIPSGRGGHSMNIYRTERIFIFGGFMFDINTRITDLMNDLWSYELTTLRWTWISGSSLVNQPGSYGMKGIASTLNTPGCRDQHSSIINQNMGTLMIFGGINATHTFNDLWEYDINTNLWTWVSGSDMGEQSISPRRKDFMNYTDVPEPRNNHAMSFLPSINSLVMLGGYGRLQIFDDFWVYSLESKSWKRIEISLNKSQFDGDRRWGVPSPRSVSWGRAGHAFSCLDEIQKCFLYGGLLSSYIFYDDFWSLDLNITVVVESPATASGLTADEGSSINQSPQSLPIDNGSTEVLTQSDSKSPSNITLSSENSLTSTTRKHLKSTTISLSRQNSSMSNFFHRNANIFIFSGSIMGLILLLLISYYCFMRQRHYTVTSENKSETSDSTAVTLDTPSITTFSETTTTHTTTTATKVPSNQGISIPLYIKYECGKDFLIQQELFRGGMGSICLGHALAGQLGRFGSKIIVKKVMKKQMTQRDVSMFYQEVSFMKYLSDNKNIALILGYSEQPYCLLMKFYEYGSLDKWIKSPKAEKTISLILLFLIDIARGIEALHSKDLVHCDLKPQNVLIDYDQSEQRLFCVLTDFGITQIVSDENLLIKEFRVVNIRGASVFYAAPEFINRLRLKMDIPGFMLFKADIFALGVVIYEILTRKKPWKIKS